MNLILLYIVIILSTSFHIHYLVRFVNEEIASTDEDVLKSGRIKTTYNKFLEEKKKQIEKMIH